MGKENQDWKEIVHQLRIEKDPQKRNQLQRALGAALENAGFQIFSKAKPSSDDTLSCDT